MWNQDSLDKVQKSTFSSSFCKPLYKSYCFSRIPATVEHLLTGKKLSILPKESFIAEPNGYDIVILFLIDGFGWSFFERSYQKYPFLKRFVDEGIVSKITSQFPSTTAAHVTTINTGFEVGQTGVYEWFYYEPRVDRMIAPLLFSIAGERTLGNLEKLGISPRDIFPRQTLYQKLKKQKIDSYVVTPENIVNSPYSRTVCTGAHSISYLHFQEALATVAEASNSPKGHPAYFLVYFPDIDSAGHRYGVKSQEIDLSIDRCMTSLEQFFMKNVKKGTKKIACLLTADHGMVSVEPKKTVYLNQDFPELVSMMKKNGKGKPLVPAGSCRDFFLHVEDRHELEVMDLLSSHLKDRAECYLVSDLIKKGFFGSKPVSQQFLDRVGNIVVLPYEGEGVWWYEKSKFEQHFYGAHGGLTRQEMESLFLFLPLS
jgi:hypothetical protein